MPIVHYCPHCRVRLTFGEERAGTTFDCPRCNAVVRVPHAPLPRPVPPPIPRLARATGDPDTTSRESPRRCPRTWVVWAVTGAIGLLCVVVLVSVRANLPGTDPNPSGKSTPAPVTGPGLLPTHAPDRRALNHAGLEALERELLLTRPEVDAWIERGDLHIANNLKVPVPAPSAFYLMVRDCLTPERAAIEREFLRDFVLTAGREKKLREADVRRFAQSAVRTSGRYVVMEVNEELDTARGWPGVEWFQRDYVLD